MLSALCSSLYRVATITYKEIALISVLQTNVSGLTDTGCIKSKILCHFIASVTHYLLYWCFFPRWFLRLFLIYTPRYGQYSNLYPHRRGQPVQNTYCHRLFKDCAPGRCFVQSPAYPGIYPRGLSCKFRINMRQSLVGLDLTFFDVDGLRCDNLLMCFPRPISRDPADCPFDYVRVFDGPTEDHPVITTLCGRGRLKSNIVASSSEMLVTFVSSPAGPLLNTGFHFKVGWNKKCLGS